MLIPGPGLSSSENEVGGLDELSHDGDDDHLGRLGPALQSLGEGLEPGIVALGAEGGQIEQASGPASSASDEAHAFELA